MKQFKVLFLGTFLLFSSLIQVKAQTTTNTFLIEAEEFQFSGRWVVSNEIGVSGGAILSVGQTAVPNANAYSAISVKTAGTYDVWTRSPDYPTNRPGTRRFLIYVNEVAMNQESGIHGQEGYYWEKVGTAALDTGETLLRIKDTQGYYGRCDAILFTTAASFDPNQQSLAALRDFKITPNKLQLTPPSALTAAPYLPISNAATLNTEISNGKLKLQFVNVLDSVANLSRIISATSVFSNGQWIAVNNAMESNRIFLQHEAAPEVNFIGVYPVWDNSAGFSTFQSIGQTFSVFDKSNARNPFSAGELSLCRATAVTKISAQEIQVTYTTENGNTVTGVWKLATGANHLSLTLTHQAAVTGYYSFAVAALQPIGVSAVKNVQLPPMFQYQRLPDQPLLVPSALTPQPLGIVETTLNNNAYSFFVSGAPSNFPLEWATGETSPMGFSLKNESNQVQPVAFAPILGFNNSKLNAGQFLSREFIIGALPNTWDGALEYLSNQVYEVQDYRKQGTTSLTNATLNMVELIKNDNASGWDIGMKGFYDIEQNPVIAPVVVNTSPLMLLSAAVLGEDENLYLKRALPAIEYTLSRRGYRWSNKLGTLYTPTESSLKLSPYSKEFNVAYFEGLDKLTKGANPWLIDLALPNGELRTTTNSWTEKLAAYRMTQNASWLNDAIRGADLFVANDVFGTKTNALDENGFYNTSFYPNWWDLMDIYELTKYSRYLTAAEKSAFYTIAGIRSYPKVTTSQQTIHPNSTYSGTTTIWWKGAEQFRLGYPRVAGDAAEKQVAQDIVSPVGLGFEQPVTLFFPKAPILHVYMSNWAPNLLRVFQYNQKDIFQTYARNSIIGRFSNYPGYYARGFTDIPLKPDYPYVGPDVTSIYYHHIPSQLAFSVDFLVTEAMQRSQGNINFPYSRQEGFVWFNNRIFGGGKGKIYNDKEVTLLLKKDLVQASSPEVNYLTAISENKFWVIALNESSTAAAVSLTLTDSVKVASNSSIELYANDNCTPATIVMNGRAIQLTLAAKSVSALSFPLSTPFKEIKVPKLAQGIYTSVVDSNWGTFYVFRIRSPFGWDSIYAYLDTPPLENAEANLSSNIDSNTLQRLAYPYEWSSKKIPYDQQVVLNLQLTLNGVNKSLSLTVNATSN